MDGALVGRVRELDSLLGWLDEATSGTTLLVQIAGDAGIGKTALASAVARSAADRGLAVAVGRTTELDGAPPFRPWRQVLGPAAGHLLGPVTTTDPAVDRFARFQAVVDHLDAQATAAGGLLVVIEDVHRADESSVQLLVHVAEGLVGSPVCLVVTKRARSAEQSEPFAAAATQLRALPGARSIELTDLGPRDVAELLGGTHGEDVVARVVEVTAGNPLFVTELARHLESGGDPERIPGSVVEAVRGRLADRSAACVEALRLAAVSGREFPAGLVATALGVPAQACLDALDEAERAGLVEPSGRPGRFRFVHLLVRDAVEADLGVTALAEAHRRLARAVEVYEGTDDDHLADLARHWQAAAPLGEGGTAAMWCERAAGAADRRLAWEDAARLYDCAAELAGPAGDPVDRHRRLLGSARARLSCDDISVAVDRCVRAADEVRPLGRADLLAEAALVVEGRGGPPLARLRDLAAEALEVTDPDDHATRARLLGQLAVCAFYLDPAAIAELGSASMDEARRSGDPLALVAAARARQLALAGPEHAHERLRLAEVIGGAGRTLRRPSVVQWEPIWRIDALVELGRVPDAIAELVELRRRVDDVGLPMSRFHLLRTETLLAQATGRYDDAVDLGQQTCDLFGRFEDPRGGLAMVATLRAIIGLHCGFEQDMVAAFDAIDTTDPPSFLGDLPTLGPLWAVLGNGDTERARRLYDRLAPVATWDPPPFLSLHLSSLRLWAAIGLGRHDDVEALAAALDRHRGVHVAAGGGGLTYSGPVELWIGLAAIALARWDAAVRDLGSAYDACRANGAAGFAVQSGVELARALAARDGDGDRAAAVALLGEVRPSAEALGMAPWLAAADDLARGLGSASGAAGPLSPREHEVAGLVAEGLTNQAIADRLFLSVRTAQNHVQHILTKLGLSNRAQIATWYAGRRTDEGSR